MEGQIVNMDNKEEQGITDGNLNSQKVKIQIFSESESFID